MSKMEIIRRRISALSNMLLLFVWVAVCNKVGEDASTYMILTLAITYLFVTIVCGGVPDTLGRMLRSRRNKNQYKNVLRIKQSVIVFQLSLGLVFGGLLFALAGVLAEGLMKVEYCTLPLRILSVFVLFRTLSSVCTGYVRGEGFEVPASFVEILRPLFLLGFGNLFVGRLQDYGVKVSNLLQDENFAAMYSAVGIAVAVCVSEILCLIFLLVLYKGCMVLNKKERLEGLRTTDSFLTCVVGLFSGRFPLSVIQFMGVLAVLVPLFFWRRTAVTETDFTGIYSAYVRNYWFVCGILTAIVFVLAVSVLGKVFEYIRKEDKRFARITFQAGVHISIAHGVFLTAYTMVMAGQIVGILKPEMDEVVLQMLRTGAVAILSGATCCYYGRFLIAAGKKVQTMGAVVLSVVVYFILNLVLFLLGKWTETFMVYGGIFLLAVLWIALGCLAYRLMRVRMDWLRELVIPLGVGCLIGLLNMFLGNMLTPHLGNGMTLFVTFVLSLLIYWVVLLLLRNFKEQELDVIWGGRLLYALAQVLHIY